MPRNDRSDPSSIGSGRPHRPSTPVHAAEGMRTSWTRAGHGTRRPAGQLMGSAAAEEFEGMGNDVDDGLDRFDRPGGRPGNVDYQAGTHACRPPPATADRVG